MSYLKKSPWLLHYDASSCNGCDIEVLACLTPLYDVERFGIINTGNPKHADILLITGGINAQNLAKYLGFKKILACGGSWMASSDMINAGDFAKITALSKEAAEIAAQAIQTR